MSFLSFPARANRAFSLTSDLSPNFALSLALSPNFALKKIEAQYGKAEGTCVLDRGIPTEEVLAEMRNSEPPIYYLVGTPKSRLSKLEAELIGRPWEQVRPGLNVKLLAHEGELYVQAQSRDMVSKERSMRRRRLRKLWNRLCELQKMKLNTKSLLIKISEAKKEAGRAFGLIDLKLPNPGGSKKRKPKTKLNFSFRVNRAKFRETYRREGQYLLRGYLAQQAPPRFGNIAPSSRKSRKPSKI